MAFDLRSSELENTFLKERISNVEKYFYDISLKIANYNEKLALLRDSGDEFSRSIFSFATQENLNQTLRASLSEFSDIVTAVQEYRETQIQRIDTKLVSELANYCTICKKAKEELKRSLEARTIEFKKQTQLEKLRSKNPTNWQKISQAEKEMNLARDEATRITNEMARRVDSFEKRKLEDIKKTLLEFIKIEMIFYAKALELNTNAYKSIKNINVEEDLNEFRCHFRAHSATLDTNCLSNNSTKNDDIHNNEDASQTNHMLSPNHMLPLLTSKKDHLKSEDSNFSIKNLCESKFDFGDHSL